MPSLFDRVIDRNNTHSLKWDAYPNGVLPLWVADMDFQAPEPVLRALRNRVDHGIFGYESQFNELRDTVVNWTWQHYHWKINPQDILFVPGVVTSLNLAAQALASPGAGVIIQPPVYPPFFSVAKNAQLEINQAPLSHDENLNYYIDFIEFEKSIGENTKLFILCNPHNPVGRVFKQDELTKIAELCIKHKLIILSDEIHCDLVYEGHHHIPFASLNEEIAQCTITFIAPSKTFNLAGLKCSIIISQNTELRKQIEQKRCGLVGDPGTLSLIAALAAFQYGQPWLDELLQYLQGNRDWLCKYLQNNLPSINMPPIEGTYLAWLDCHLLNLKPNPYDFFLQNAKVALNNGPTFGSGGEGFVRLNFGCPREILEEALLRMTTAIEQVLE